MKKNFFLSALLLVLAFAINFQAMAQATFRDYFQSLVAEKELAGNFSSSKEKFSTTYTLVLGQTNMDKATAQKIINEYLNTQFKDDFIDCIYPFYEKEMSIEDIKALTALLDTEEGRAAMKNLKKIDKEAESAEFQTFIQNIMVKLITGKESEPQKVLASESFQKKFEEYWTVSQSEKIMRSSFISSFMQGVTANKKTEEDIQHYEQMAEKTSVVFIKEMKTYVCNTSFNQVTEADLDYYIKTFGTPAGQKFIQGTNNMASSNIEEFGMNILKKFYLWIQESMKKNLE